jgi:phage terminase large subunit-like protein
VNSVAEALALVQCAPDITEGLTGAELAVALWDLDSWLRPDQRFPSRPFSSFGFVGGRGFGKSFAIACQFNARVETGLIKAPALMGPNADRVDEVQIDFLVDTSPPWFKAERRNGSVIWPNGVTADVFTSLEPERPRSGNYDVSWLCELVDWDTSRMRDAFANIVTATRVGEQPYVLWDTTSKGKNAVIQQLLASNRADPTANIIRRGVSFDNPMLSRAYLRRLCSMWGDRNSRRYREEIYGEVFTEAAGALWEQCWIDNNRVTSRGEVELTIIGLDPALSARADADETGLIVASRDKRRHEYVDRDLSGRHTPEQWATIIVDECQRGAAGVVVERNHLGDTPRDLIKVHAANRGMRLEVLGKDEPFPMRRAGVVFVREVVAASSKGHRAQAPAALYHQGLVHHVGVHDELELEQTTWEPDSKKSPNRLDACCYAIAELAGVRFDESPDARVEVHAAAKAQTQLRQSLLGIGANRRVGY